MWAETKAEGANVGEGILNPVQIFLSNILYYRLITQSYTLWANLRDNSFSVQPPSF